MAFPGYKEPPIVIDMATSAAAYGKIEIALRKKTRLPKGWIVDKKGRMATDPRKMVDGGARGLCLLARGYPFQLRDGGTFQAEGAA